MRDILPIVIKKLFLINYKNLTDEELLRIINNIDNELERKLTLKRFR